MEKLLQPVVSPVPTSAHLVPLTNCGFEVLLDPHPLSGRSSRNEKLLSCETVQWTVPQQEAGLWVRVKGETASQFLSAGCPGHGRMFCFVIPFDLIMWCRHP